MLDWLKRQARSGHSKSTEDGLRSGSSGAADTNDERQKAYRQAAFNFLLKEYGLDPVFRPDILSEEDYNTRLLDMPLIAVWNEKLTDDGFSFSISVSPFLIWCVPPILG
ncbi:MAG: hypothetical protein JWQ16_1825 [Novosphingobium sp.]|nr:hypothetical protein [Novosphingobium sp.]